MKPKIHDIRSKGVENLKMYSLTLFNLNNGIVKISQSRTRQMFQIFIALYYIGLMIQRFHFHSWS